jgi:hypothetical protein
MYGKENFGRRAGLLVIAFFFAGGFALLSGGAAPAQEPPSPEDQRAAELIKEIKEGMKRIDEKLAEAGKTKGSARESIDALLHEARRKHRKVIRDIEELIRSVKYSQSDSSGSSGKPKSKKPENQGKKEQERRNDPSGDELKKNQDKPEDGRENPKDGDPSRDKPRQEDSQNPRKDGAPEDAGHRDASGRWGLLPPKVQEEILNSNVEDFPQKYRKWLEEYYRRAGKKR